MKGTEVRELPDGRMAVTETVTDGSWAIAVAVSFGEPAGIALRFRDHDCAITEEEHEIPHLSVEGAKGLAAALLASLERIEDDEERRRVAELRARGLRAGVDDGVPLPGRTGGRRHGRDR